MTLLAPSLALALLLAGCGGPASTVFTSPPPTDAVIAYLTGSNYTGSARVIGLRGTDGTQAWRMPIGERDNDGATAVVDGVLYVEAGPATFTPSPNPPAGGDILALRLRDGTILWRTPLPQLDYRVGVAADATSVVAAAGDGGLYALDPANGAIRWHVAARVDGRPHLADGVVVVSLARDSATNQTGGVSALAAYRESDGALLWQNAFTSSVATNALAAYTTVGDGTFALSSRDGHQLWEYPSGSTVEGGGADNYHGEVIGASAKLVLIQTTFPVVSNDLPTKDYVAALDAATGTVRWKATPGFDGTLDFGGPIVGVGASGETTIYGAYKHKLVARRSDDGTQAWASDLAPYTAQQLTVTDGVLFALLYPPPCELGPCFGATKMRMAAVDAATGTSYWQRDLPDATVLVTG